MIITMDKREHDSDSTTLEQAAKRSKSMVCFRLLIPASAAGSVIGKGGENVNKIKSKCCPGAYIRVPESPSRSTERLVLVTCDVQDISLVIDELSRPIFRALTEDKDLPETHCSEILMLISTFQAGYIVGKGGATAARLREESGCKVIKVYKDKLPYSEERVIEMRGDKEEIGTAVRLILEIVDENPLKHEIYHYSPAPDHKIVGDCGGYLQYKSRNSFSSNLNSSYDGGPSIQSFNQYPSRDIPSRDIPSRDIPSRDLPAYGTGCLQRTIVVDDRRDPVPLRYDRVDRMMDRKYTTRTKDIYIDDCYTAHVIGAKGSQIQLIRQQSGATIKVADNNTVKDNERNIQITGAEHQIERALELINQTIMEKYEKDKRQSRDNGGIETDKRNKSTNFYGKSELFEKITASFPFNDINDESTEQTTQTIYIPNEYAAPVIGPRGMRVSEIRRYTKCHVNIESDGDVQGDERKITLTGTPRQIHRAAFMIQNIPGTFNVS